MAALAGRTAIVTGASKGIGAEIARQLAKAGARVALASRDKPLLDQVARAIGDNAIAIECDITDRESVAAAGARVRKEFGGAPDIIVNNAGLFRVAPIDAMKPEDFIASITTNVIGPFLVMHEFLAEMRQRGSGHVVTIGSTGDRLIFPGNAAYSAGKFGIRAMHYVLRADLRGTGVRASLISPSSVDTALWDHLDTESEESDFPSRSEMLNPGDVARAVMFALTQPEPVNVDELRISRA
ncbi:MAG: SDR family oxidoreductase [Gemmatimonadota bacterium]|nr:SDR family oxidoreductase [Gemmatimonadota bacterium]